MKSLSVEPSEVVASRIYQALKVVPAHRLMINSDCGLRHLPPTVARAKLVSMTLAADRVRADVLGVPLVPSSLVDKVAAVVKERKR